MMGSCSGWNCEDSGAFFLGVTGPRSGAFARVVRTAFSRIRAGEKSVCN